MTLKQIKKRIKKIKDMSSDDECAHSEEDLLREDFIKYISEISRYDLDGINYKAELILSTNDIKFARWCA